MSEEKSIMVWVDWKLWFVGAGVDVMRARKEVCLHFGPLHVSFVWGAY